MYKLKSMIYTFVITIALLLSNVEALTTKILAQKQFCLVKHMQPSVDLTFNFDVASGYPMTIECSIKTHSGHILKEWNQVASGNYTIQGKHFDEEYTICFHNSNLRAIPKWVSFYFESSHHLEPAKSEHLDPIEVETEKIVKLVHSMKVANNVLRHTHKQHQYIVGHSHTSYVYWACLQWVFLLIVVIIQGLFLQRFLETKQRI